METLEFIIIILLIVAMVLFLISRNYLKNTMKTANRAGQLEEMTKKVSKYAYEGKDKNEIIENLMRDFNLGEREAEYMYSRTRKQKFEEEKNENHTT